MKISLTAFGIILLFITNSAYAFCLFSCAEDEIQILYEKGDAAGLAQYLGKSHYHETFGAVLGSSSEAKLAENALVEMGRRGNEAAVIELINAGYSLSIRGMLQDGEIGESLKPVATALILEDINDNTIGSLSVHRNRIALDILTEKINSVDSEIVLKGWEDIARISSYPVQGLSYTFSKRGATKINMSTWLRDELVKELKDSVSRAEIRRNLTLLLAEEDRRVKSGAVYLLIHLDAANENSKYWPSILNVVRQHIKRKERTLALNNWPITKSILLSDVRSDEYNKILAAVVAFIGIGEKTIIPELEEILDNEGDKKMAEAFLNSGSKELRVSAEHWAKAKGYKIETGEGYHPVNWGKW